MPIINLGPFGRFEIRRTRQENEPLLLRHSDITHHTLPTQVSLSLYEALPEQDAPPPYSAVPPRCLSPAAGLGTAPEQELVDTIRDLEWQGPTQATSPACRTQQLQRYLVEILALTLDADFDALNAALYDDDNIVHTNSTLSAGERAELLSLSRLVIKASRAVSAEQNIDRLDKQVLQRAIIGPSTGASFTPKFTLDLVGWYGGPLSHPTSWSETIPGQIATNHKVSPTRPVNRARQTPQCLMNEYSAKSMGAFREAIHDYTPNAKAEAVLDKAFQECRRRYGYDVIKRNVLYWPVRYGVDKLHEALRDGHKVPLPSQWCIQRHVLKRCRCEADVAQEDQERSGEGIVVLADTA